MAVLTIGTDDAVGYFMLVIVADGSGGRPAEEVAQNLENVVLTE